MGHEREAIRGRGRDGAREMARRCTEEGSLRVDARRTWHSDSPLRKAAWPTRRSSHSTACNTAYTTFPRGASRAQSCRPASNAERPCMATASPAKSKTVSETFRCDGVAGPTDPRLRRHLLRVSFFGFFGFHDISIHPEDIARALGSSTPGSPKTGILWWPPRTQRSPFLG